ncbi:Eukaryotic translation initiation factor 2A [Blomia tropicalis]|nr:Eukaryotic translation initiation factor 2A [Blomia tropicalis]
MNEPKFLTHTAKGVQLWSQQVNNKSVQIKEILIEGEEARLINSCFVSDDGNYLAIALCDSVRIYRQEQPNCGFNKVLFSLNVRDARSIQFSPKLSWVVIQTLMGSPEEKNLKIYNLSTGELNYETNDKRRDSIKWTNDESLAFRMVGSELYFYENNDFTKPTKKISQKIFSYSLAHNQKGCVYFAIFIKGTKGSPSSVKVYAYPHTENIIASQSLFKADSVEIKWNKKGDAMLITAIKDIDTTGKSYYGESSLHFLDLKGNACLIGGKKEGPVHSCEWLPNNDGFIAVYGRTPAAVTLHNNKGDPIFEFGEVPVNSISFNPFGNLVAFTGFGNLSGDVYIWNLKTRTKISHFQASDTTHFCWGADGLNLLTSTTYARLKVANGFKVWDFLGNLLHTEDCRDEGSVPMFKMLPIPSSTFQPPEIGANVKGKILSDIPVQRYIPPFLRNKQQQQEFAKRLEMKNKPDGDALMKEKKLRNLNKKLEQIEALKKSLSDGKQLEKNQLEKIEKENEIISEINALKLNA